MITRVFRHVNREQQQIPALDRLQMEFLELLSDPNCIVRKACHEALDAMKQMEISSAVNDKLQSSLRSFQALDEDDPKLRKISIGHVEHMAT